MQADRLNSQPLLGRNKARVFASIGFRAADAEELRVALLAAARNTEARFGIANPYGQGHIVDFGLVRPGRAGEDLPRLTSCYVL
jgi:hypothetical protein